MAHLLKHHTLNNGAVVDDPAYPIGPDEWDENHDLTLDDSLIDHGSIGGLTTGDAGHTQFALVDHAFAVIGPVDARLTDARRLVAGAGIVLNDGGPGGDLEIVGSSVTQYTNEDAQDAVGAMVDTSLIYADVTPLLSRAALTGAITAPQGSNATSLGSFTKAQLDAAVSDGNVLFVGDITQYTDELAQDAIGAMIDGTLVYADATPLLTRAALTGAITAAQASNVTALGSFTKAQLSAAVSDGDVLFVGDITQYTDELAQDAVGAMVDGTLVYVDATPLLTRAALTGHITSAQGSNATVLGSFTKAQLDVAVSDGNVLYVGDVTQYTDEMAEDAVGGILTDSATIDFTYDDGANTITAIVIQSGITHSSLGGLTTSDAGHTQFALLAGRGGGQTLNGGANIGATLTLVSTSNGTKGTIGFGATAPTVYDETNDRFGINKGTPLVRLHVVGDERLSGYLGVGNDASAPANTTAGDLTAIRGFISTGPFVIGGTGVPTNIQFNLGGTVTHDAANAFGMYMGGLTYNMTASSRNAFGIYSGGVVATGAGSLTGLGYFGAYIEAASKTGNGTVATAVGLHISHPTIGTGNYTFDVTGSPHASYIYGLNNSVAGAILTRQVGARAYKAADQTGILDGATTVLVLDTERWDSDAFHDTVTNNSRFTIPTGLGGYYMMGYNIRWDSNTTGARFAGFRLNGTTFISSDQQIGSAQAYQSGVTYYLLAAGDYVEVCVVNSSGGTRSIIAAGNYSPEAWIKLDHLT